MTQRLPRKEEISEAYRSSRDPDLIDEAPQVLALLRELRCGAVHALRHGLVGCTHGRLKFRLWKRQVDIFEFAPPKGDDVMRRNASEQNIQSSQ